MWENFQNKIRVRIVLVNQKLERDGIYERGGGIKLGSQMQREKFQSFGEGIF